MTDAPNFLFIITDQQRADHLGCYGNPLLKTPNIDAIAARGTRFDRFYVVDPICMPNRSTIMTGRMPSLHGVRHNGIALSREHTTFVDVLRAAGYRTGLVGKAHLQNMTGLPASFGYSPPDGLDPPPPGFSDAFHGERSGPGYDLEQPADWSDKGLSGFGESFYGFDHVELCTFHGDMVRGHYLNWLAERDPEAARRWGPEGSASSADRPAPQARKPAVPAELYPTAYIAERTIAWLEARANAPSGEPFFLQCSFPDPHHPFTPPGKYWDMYDPADIELPATFHDRSNNPIPPLQALYDEQAAGTADRSFVRPFAVTEEEARSCIALTYGMIAFIDDAVGQILATLDRLGLAENTVVIFTSDHGDWMGDHGIMLKGPLHYQGLVRIPFLWADPEGGQSPQNDGLASSLDIARSVLTRAGIAPFNGCQGQDLNPMRAGGASAHDGVMIEQTTQRPYLGFTKPVRIHTFIDERWRLTFWQGVPWGELYDLERDPAERTNLWDDPAHAATRAELTERMLRAAIDLNDTAPLATGEA